MRAIVFVTLFLGLTVGIQTVEVAVDDNVETVEYRLDGEVVQRFAGPPWKAAVDLGDELIPRRLTAVALDGDGAELGRTGRWLNLTGRPADVRLWVERDGEGAVVRGGLSWQSHVHAGYRSLVVTLDGEPLAVDSPGTFDLPPHDAGSLHVLSAELVLPDGNAVRADIAFGGRFGERVSSGLTGVPVEVDGRRRLRRAADAGDWLRLDGEPRPVLAVDHGEADLYVVMDRGAGNDLAELGVLLAKRIGQGATLRVVRTEHGTHKQMALHQPVRDDPLRHLGLHPGDRMYLVRPVAQRSPTGYRNFGVSVPVTADDGGSAWQLTFRRFPDRGWGRPQLLAEAVATVAMSAAGSGRPRAMVLVLGPDARDDSAFTPGQVRRYLRRLAVPLEVWYVDLGNAEGDDRDDPEQARRQRLAAAREAWGDGVRDVSGLPSWLRVNRQLRERLERQRILWIEGIQPPSAVRVAGAPEWLRPVGGGTAAVVE